MLARGEADDATESSINGFTTLQHDQSDQRDGDKDVVISD